MSFVRLVIGIAVIALSTGCAQILGLEESTLVDAGTDTATAVDSAATDTAVDTFVPPDAPAGAPEILFFFGAPDRTAEYLCILTLDSDSDMAMPTGQFGPYGPFAYGSSLRLASDAATAFTTKPVAAFVLDTNPGSDAMACGKAWMTAHTDLQRQERLATGTVKPGEAWAISLVGCAGAALPDGECGATGNNLDFFSRKLDTNPPPAGKLGIQLLNLSLYASSGMQPSLANVDGYLQAFSAMTAGPMQKVGDGVVAKTVGGRLDINPPSGTDPLLILVQSKQMPCAFTPPSPPPCAEVLVKLNDALTTAQAADPTLLLAAGQSLVIAFAGTPKTMPPTIAPMIARVR